MPVKALTFMAILFLSLNFLIFLPGFLLSGESWTLLPGFQESKHWSLFGLILVLLFRRDTLDPWRLSADLFILSICFLFFPGKTRLLRKHYYLWTLWFIILLLYEIYVAVAAYFMGKPALFAEDWSYLLSTWHFLCSLEIMKLISYLTAFLLGFITIFFLIKTFFKKMARHQWVVGWKPRTKLFLMFSLITYAILCFQWYGVENRRLILQMSSLKIFANVQRSLDYIKYEKKNELQLPHYLEHPPFVEKPNIYLFIVESYGQVLLEHPKLQADFKNFLQVKELLLKAENFHMRSSLSQSPVFGGRSWLSQASIFSGNMVSHQWQYENLLKMGLQDKNLAAFLRSNGYHTVGLYPGNRRQVNALGSHNVYQKDRVFSYDDLHYTGPAYNWGNVPDQYSLNYVWENYIRQLSGPYFLSFLTISSHAPWNPRPQFVTDWRELNQVRSDRSASRPGPVRGIFDRIAMNWLKFYEDQHAYQQYFQSIVYQWQVFEDFLVKHAGDQDVFVLIGDHQPYLAQWSTGKESTLIHVISKNEKTLAAFSGSSMLPGLQPKTGPMMQHADIHDLIVDALYQLNDHMQSFSRR